MTDSASAANVAAQTNTPNTPAAKEKAPAAAKPKTETKANGESSFENKEANNPLASQNTPRKTLQQKILDLAAQKEAKDAAAAAAKEKKPEPKKSAVLNPDDGRTGKDIKDASAVASQKAPKKEATPKVEEPEPEPQTENDENEFQSLDGTTNEPEVDEPEPNAEKWEPDYKFKTMKFQPTGDPENPMAATQVDCEIPEKFRSLITDKESEQELKTIFAAANGIEFVQTRRDQYKAEKEQAVQYIDQIKERLGGVDSMIRAGDLDSAFETMAIPEEKVLQWVLDKINYSQLDPSQQRLIDGQRESDKRAKRLEMENQTIAQRNMQLIGSQKSMALDAILDRPDLKPVIAAYDARPGKKPQDLSFRDLVINHGDLSWRRSNGKTDISEIEAVESVMRYLGLAQAQPGNTAQAQAQVTPAAGASQRPQPKPAQSLPNVASRAASPTQPKIKNMKQLMEHRKQILGI